MFLSALDLRADLMPDLWVIRAPLIWCDPICGRIEVPLGFRTDLASIPRIFRNLPDFDPNGLSRRPAAMHDWLYAERSKGKDFADRFLLESLQIEGMGHIAAMEYYDAVHFFGGTAWLSDAGALETKDFDDETNYRNWRNSHA